MFYFALTGLTLAIITAIFGFSGFAITFALITQIASFLLLVPIITDFVASLI